MDKELRDGSSLWPDGEMPTFNDDVDEWCNCQDNPDNYWEKLTLVDLKFNNDEANFKWTWGNHFFYGVKAGKENNVWKITGLERFTIKNFSWQIVVAATMALVIAKKMRTKKIDDVNQRTTQAVQIRQAGGKDDYDVEAPAYQITDKVLNEIKKTRN